MTTPNFFIVGAAKAGTTSIHSYLSEHPDIFMTEPKEVNFFSHQNILGQQLYYKDYICQKESEYEKLFSECGSTKAVGEASVSYLFYPGVAERVKAYSSRAKILIFLRNPVDRGYSHFMMDRRLGLVNDDYDDIVFRRSTHNHAELYYQQYVELGLYYKQVKKYLDVFGEESVRIFLLEDLVLDLESVTKEIFSFLEVDESFLPDLEKKHNEFLLPKTELMRWFYSKHHVRKFLKTLMPTALVELIKSNFTKNVTKPSMQDELRNQLLSIYGNDIEMLASLIGRDLSNWRK